MPQAKHQEEAIKFARFVTNSDNQLAFDKKANVFPSSEGYPLTTNSSTRPTIPWTPKPCVCPPIRFATVRFGAGPVHLRLLHHAAWGKSPQALQGKITAKEALDATVKYCNERL